MGAQCVPVLSAGPQRCVPPGGAAAGELGIRSGSRQQKIQPTHPLATFQTLMGEVLKTSTLEIKCTHVNVHTYIRTQ